MRNSTEIYYTVVLATVFFILLVGVVVMAISRYYNRKRAHEMAVFEFDRILLQSRLEIQEQTFKSISQEMHDNLGQLLTLAKLQLNTLTLSKTEQAREKIDDAIGLISQTIQSLRDLSKNLHADTITKTGLIHALETEIRLIEKLGILQPVFRVFGQPVPITTDKSLIIFRIVQEALHNVVKHARATLVEMHVHFSFGQVRLTIADNGMGFDWNDTTNKGSGLRNMTDRARVIGAELEMQPSPNSGTIIILTIPQV